MTHPHPELGLPPALAADALRIVALGGLGEIGRNMTVFEHAGRLLIVDCGVLFPEDSQPGVDLILPDFEYVEGPARRRRGDRADARPRGPHRRGPVPAPRAGGHPAARLAAHPGAARGEAARAPHQGEHDRGRGGPAGAGRSLRHRVPGRQPLHPRRARPVDRHVRGPGAAHRRLQDGPAAARRAHHRPQRVRPRSATRVSTCCWSTRPTPRSPDSSPASATSCRCSTRVFLRAEGRIILASFASHIHRIQQVIDTAVLHERKVAFVGRSMVRNMGVARDLGYLQSPRACWCRSTSWPSCPTTRRSWCAPGRRASRWRCCRASPTATTRSRWARATRSCWRRR